MTSRQRLPNRRASENYTFECGGLMYTATIARFPDGRIGEVFLNNHKTNSGADVATRDSAIVLSFALQFGADLETIGRSSHTRRTALLANQISQSTDESRMDRGDRSGRSDPCALPYANPHDEPRKIVMMSRREIGKPRVRANGGIHD